MNVRATRKILFNKDPHCYWCGIPTVETDQRPMQAHFATLEHLYSTRDPRRTKKGRREARFDRNAILYVIACFGCNQERSRAQIKNRVFVPKLQVRRQLAESLL